MRVLSREGIQNLPFRVRSDLADSLESRTAREIVARHGLLDRVTVRSFDARASHLGFAASDLTLIPSRFEPRGLPHMIGCIYGSLPIVHSLRSAASTVRERQAPGLSRRSRQPNKRVNHTKEGELHKIAIARV